jgi:hypothetical protein
MALPVNFKLPLTPFFLQTLFCYTDLHYIQRNFTWWSSHPLSGVKIDLSLRHLNCWNLRCSRCILRAWRASESVLHKTGPLSKWGKNASVQWEIASYFYTQTSEGKLDHLTLGSLLFRVESHVGLLALLDIAVKTRTILILCLIQHNIMTIFQQSATSALDANGRYIYIHSMA